MKALQMPAAAVTLLTLLQTQDVWNRLDSWCFPIVTLTESLLSEQVIQNLTSYQISSQTPSFFMKKAQLSSTSYTIYLKNKSSPKIKVQIWKKKKIS